MFPHDDTTQDRAPGSKLSTSGDRTRQLWRELYQEDFFFPGAMYRGEKPDDQTFSSNKNFEYNLFYNKTGTFQLLESRLICKRSVKHPEKTKYHMLVTQNKFNIYEDDLNIHDVSRFEHICKFDQLDEKSLNLRVWLKYKESFSEKFKTALKLEPKHLNNYSYFDPKFIIPDQAAEYQNFGFNLKDTYENEFTLNQKWMISVSKENSIGLELIQQPFNTIHMKDILHEYAAFDLKNRNFQGKNGEGIRAQHVVTSLMNNEKVSLFKAEILHIVSLQWSSVKISLEDRVLSTAHLIGWTQLPSDEQIKHSLSCITFDPKSERAMLVRNLLGDYAIVKGKWVGKRRGIPPKSRGMRGQKFLFLIHVFLPLVLFFAFNKYFYFIQ